MHHIVLCDLAQVEVDAQKEAPTLSERQLLNVRRTCCRRVQSTLGVMKALQHERSFLAHQSTECVVWQFNSNARMGRVMKQLLSN